MIAGLPLSDAEKSDAVRRLMVRRECHQYGELQDSLPGSVDSINAKHGVASQFR
jgi:hypothetical protein